jgi:hypothetical protein
MNRYKKASDKKGGEPSQPQQALRNYSDESQQTDPSMRFFRLQVTAYWLLPLLLFLIILIIGTYLAFTLVIIPNRSTEGELGPLYYNAEGEIDVSEVSKLHLEAIGGRVALEGIRSVRYKSKLRESNGEIEMQILILRPDKGMIMTNPGSDDSQKLVVNGDIAWQVVKDGKGGEKSIRLDSANAASMASSLKVHNTLRRQILARGGEGFSAREVDYEGRPALELTKNMADGSTFTAVLDKNTLYQLQSIEMFAGPEGMNRVETHYSDHREASGIIFAFETRVYKDGNLFNTTVTESIEINSGLISSLFAVPEDLSL